MIRKMICFFFLIPTSYIAHGGPTGQYFISTPVNTTVNSGHHARLPCTVGNIVGTCQWTRDGFALGTDRNLAGYSRYQMVGDREDICDLRIDPVLPIDEGVYQCQVSGDHGVGPISSAPVSLIVSSEPGQPFIVQAMGDGVMEVKEGEEVELQCESQGGRPPAEIQWWDGEGRKIVSDVTEHIRRMQDRKTFKTVSILKFAPKQPISVRCTVSNEAFQEDKHSEILEIKFKGQVEIESKYLSEGESFHIDCNKNESQNMNYKWFINDKEIFSENSKTLQIEHFVSAYDKSIVKCVGEGKLGEMEVFRLVRLNLDSSHDINLKETMVLPSRPVNKYKIHQPRREGKHINVKKTIFTCIADEETSEQPTYIWMKGKVEDRVIGEDDENRKFNCEVIQKGYKKLNQMTQNMKYISRTFKKFRRSFNQLVTAVEST